MVKRYVLFMPVITSFCLKVRFYICVSTSANNDLVISITETASVMHSVKGIGIFHKVFLTNF